MKPGNSPSPSQEEDLTPSTPPQEQGRLSPPSPLLQELQDASRDRHTLFNVPLLRRAGSGLMLGALCGLAADQLGLLNLLEWEDLLIFPALVGAALTVTRARVVVPITAGILLALLVLVGYTPMVDHLMPTLERRDLLQPSQAIIVLSATTMRDRSLGVRAQERILQGYKLLREGYAPRLILTNATVPHGTQVPAVRRQMKTLGLNYPIIQTGQVTDTHDEAIEVAKLAHRHGWRLFILVTHPWHMRRAAAVFEKAGVHVLCSPCVEGEYDLNSMDKPSYRFRAFRDWLHETLGYLIYRRRGWL